jgi:hypothetical protein
LSGIVGKRQLLKANDGLERFVAEFAVGLLVWAARKRKRHLNAKNRNQRFLDAAHGICVVGWRRGFDNRIACGGLFQTGISCQKS